LQPGWYEVFATWQSGEGRDAQATYRAFLGAEAVSTAALKISDVDTVQRDQTTAPSGQAIDSPTADFSQNGYVDGADFLTWQMNFGASESATRSQGDANQNRQIDAQDLTLWSYSFGEASAPRSGAISLGGVAWESLGVVYIDAANALTIQLTNGSTGITVADGMAIAPLRNLNLKSLDLRGNPLNNDAQDFLLESLVKQNIQVQPKTNSNVAGSSDLPYLPETSAPFPLQSNQDDFEIEPATNELRLVIGPSAVNYEAIAPPPGVVEFSAIVADSISSGTSTLATEIAGIFATDIVAEEGAALQTNSLNHASHVSQGRQTELLHTDIALAPSASLTVLTGTAIDRRGRLPDARSSRFDIRDVAFDDLFSRKEAEHTRQMVYKDRNKYAIALTNGQLDAASACISFSEWRQEASRTRDMPSSSLADMEERQLSVDDAFESSGSRWLRL
jgi:hypothetical protein